MASFTVNSAEFLNAINSIYPIVPNKPPRDILKCFRIKASQGANDCLEIFATDLETFATAKLEDSVMVQAAGDFVVPAAALLDYARSLDGGNATFLVTEQESLEISEGEAKFSVGLQDLDEYPDFPDRPEDINWVTVPLPEFSKALNQVIFAVADKGSPRWGTLNAVCLETGSQEISLIGTDQVRASITNIRIPELDRESQYLVPSKTLGLIPKMFQSEEIQLSLESNNNLIFRDDTTEVLIRLLQGAYPPVKDFIQNHPRQVAIEAGDFLKEVKKSALATDNNSPLKLELTANKIKLSAKTRKQRRTVRVEFPLEYDGEDFKTALNCKFLIDMLKAASNAEPLEMHFNQSNNPLQFTQDGFLHLIVPQPI
jgi:DNA polymerase III beta subunit